MCLRPSNTNWAEILFHYSTSFLCVHLNLRGRPDSDDRPSVPTPSPLGWQTLVSFGLQKRNKKPYRILKSPSLVSWTCCHVKKKKKNNNLQIPAGLAEETAAPLCFQELFVSLLRHVAALQNKNPSINANTSDFQDDGRLSGTASCSC